jgi:hypothetical protein
MKQVTIKPEGSVLKIQFHNWGILPSLRFLVLMLRGREIELINPPKKSRA